MERKKEMKEAVQMRAENMFYARLTTASSKLQPFVMRTSAALTTHTKL
jgi:hypothetical protein